MKLRKLLSKVKADFLATTKAAIEVRLAKIPMTMTYEIAIATFRNTVNNQFPPEMTANQRVRRNINEVNQRGGRGRGRWNSRGPGRGRTKKNQNDSTWITLLNGQRIEYHPSFKFPNNIYQQKTRSDLRRSVTNTNPNNNHREQSNNSNHSLNKYNPK